MPKLFSPALFSARIRTCLALVAAALATVPLQTIADPLTTAGAGTLTLNAGTSSGTLLLSGTTTINAGSLIKTGAGTLTFSSAASNALPAAGTFAVSSGSITSVVNSGGTLTLNGGTLITGATVTNSAILNLGTQLSTVNLGVGTTLNAGAVSFIKTGAGTLTLTGNNMYSGATIANSTTNLILTQGTPLSGTLTIHAPTFQSGALNLTSGTLVNGAGTLSLTSGATVNVTTVPVLALNQQLFLTNGAPIVFTSNFPVALSAGGLTNTFIFPGTGLFPGGTTLDYGTTTSAAPAATGSATLLSNRAVSVHGSFFAQVANPQITFYVQYGLTTAYEKEIQVAAAQTARASGNQPIFAQLLDGLAPGSTYHYRTKAVETPDSAGGSGVRTFFGADKTFKTAAPADWGVVWYYGTPVSLEGLYPPFGITVSEPFPPYPTTNGQPLARQLLSFYSGPYGTVTANGGTLTYSPKSTFENEDFVQVRIGFSNALPPSAALDPSPASASFTANVKIIRARPPGAVTGAAVIGSNSQVLLKGVFAGNGPGTRPSFEYGFDTSYGKVATPSGFLFQNGYYPAFEFPTLLSGLEPGRTYHYRARATNAIGTTVGVDQTFTTPPYVDGSFLVVKDSPVSFDGLARVQVPWIVPTASASSVIITGTGSGGIDPAAVGSVSQGAYGAVTRFGNTITYTPGPSFAGSDSFTYTVVDPRISVFNLDPGLPVHVPFSVRVEVRSILGGARIAASKGAAVAGTSFTYGAIGAAEAGAFSGTLRAGSKSIAAIFATSGSVKVKVGDAAPGLTGSAITDLGAPSGQAALATLKIGAGPVSSKNDTVLLGGLDGTPRIAAREGQAFSNVAGMSIKSFGAFDGNGSVIFFRALLQGSGVAENSDSAVCAALPDGRVRLLVREGAGISTIATLVGLPGTLAEGRWRAGSDQLGVRLSFSDGSQVISIVRVPVSAPEEWTVLHHLPARASVRVAEAGVPSVLDGTSDLGLGLPGFGSGGGAAYYLTSRTGPGGITAANNVALLSGYNTVLARKSDGAPGTESEFKSFGDPIVGTAGRIAFTATVAGPGVNAGNKTGLWFATDGVTPNLVARARGDAPGGGQFGAFTSLALPDSPTRGPIFTGTLVVDSAHGINAKNNVGLWGMDSAGNLQLLLRTGQSLTVSGAAKIVTSFVALTPPAGSIGAAHGYDDAGHVSALVTFEDRSVVLLKLSVP